VGLGVTPSATWSSSARAIQLGGFNSIFGYTSNVFRLANNAIFTASNETYGASSIGATYYQQYNGAHSWFNAASGTAGNTISFAQAMTLDASGNLLLGTTSAFSAAANRVDFSMNGVTDSIISLGAASARRGVVYASASEMQIGTKTAIPLTFQTSDTERARIDSSGNLLVGNISAGDGKVRISASANSFNLLKIDDTGSIAGNYVQFLNSAGSQAGAINHSGTTSVSYNSGSDYRLKTITGPVTNSAEFINSLKPKVGTWKEDGSKFVGFLAHEFAEVCPQAVQGEKDAVDENGKPLYQSMEASSPEVIANIVSLLQEQQAIIQTLTDRITALEQA
jgi:hypothetical protein